MMYLKQLLKRPVRQSHGMLFVYMLILISGTALATEADMILYHGRIVTVDRNFSVQQALAIKSNCILQVGKDDEILRLRGKQSKVVDLAGKMVLPGLMDSHAHPATACMTEFDHPIPLMAGIQEVLDY